MPTARVARVAKMTAVGSPSIAEQGYWWYRARAGLLKTILEQYVTGAQQILDVGSADGPSVGWLRSHRNHVALDIDPRGLDKGGICGSALALPFADESFDVVAAFDVVEHCDPEATAVAELVRVLRPGGRLLVSVPAYQWAWTRHDDDNGHHRRYTKERAVRALGAGGVTVERATYVFASTFPLFAAERLARRMKERAGLGPAPLADGEVPSLPSVPPALDKVLMGLSAVDQKLLSTRDLPFGSSVVVAATKPAV